MWPKPQETAYLVTSTEDIFNIIFVEGCSFSKKNDPSSSWKMYFDDLRKILENTSACPQFL